jgi:hypothetical protein
MTLSTTIILSSLEDVFFTWAWNNIPTLLFTALLVWFAWWMRGELNAISNRFSKLEVDYQRVDKKLKSFGKRLTRVEKKLDTLIVYLTSRKKIDSDLPLQ